MKKLCAKKEHICNKCNKVIEWNQEYYGSSYKDLCISCGKDYLENKSQSVSKTTKCKFCKEPAIGVLYNNPICKVHVGEVMEAP